MNIFKKNNKKNSGVTMIELTVVLFIFIVISGMTIFNYSKFNTSISTQNLADDVALSVRRAQGYAIGVRGSGNNFQIGYGVHFAPKIFTAGSEYKGSEKSFVLFADIDSDYKYDYLSYDGCGAPKSGNECMEILSILSNDKISGIYLNAGLGNQEQVPVDGSVEILFKRPNPEPVFCYRSDVVHESCDKNNSSISNVKINITNNYNGQTTNRSVTITNNGQISVTSS